MNAMNIILKRVLASITVLVALTFNTMGQGQVKIMVSPKYDPMPPAVLNYVGDPGKYFQISLENVTDEVLNVYLGLELQQVTPNTGLSLSTPPEAMPQQPLVLLPHKLLVLDVVTQKQLFRHLNVNQIRMSGGVLTDYTRGVIALLAEGTYSGQITAYRYDPGNRNPEVLSDPIMGRCMFNVCYSGTAPQFIPPLTSSLSTERGRLGNQKVRTQIEKNGKRYADNGDILDGNSKGGSLAQSQFGPRLQWTPPMTACAGKRQYRYSLRIVKAVLGQTAEEAMNYGADVYRRSGLLATYCTLPTTIIKQMASSPGMYVCQVTAEPVGGNMSDKSDYVLLQNGGKSELLVFEIPHLKGNINNDQGKTTQEQTDHKEGADSTAQKDSIDSLKCKYHIAQPVLTSPHPDREDVRTLTIQPGESISMAWEKSIVSESLATNSDTLSLKYKIEAWKWFTGQTEEALKASKPFYVKKDIAELSDSIVWKELKKVVSGSTRIRLRVTVSYPFGKDSIEIGEDVRNFIDITYVASLAERFPDCHPGAAGAIKDKTLGDFSNADLKGKTVKVGNFDLTVEKIEKTSVTVGGKSKECYKGEGYVTWMPLNSKIKISVKFDTLFINKDREVYDGKVVSAEVDRNFIPYDIFDGWGLDYFGSTETYGKYLTDYMKKEDGLKKYHDWLQESCMLISNIANAELGPLTLPLKLPKEINKTPLDIQILKAEFSANSSWMNVIGEFVLPESDPGSSDVLVFGAPRQCITPNALFAEAGCLSLLSNITAKDPKSQYTFTFKAPSTPGVATDGCYVTWDADTLSSLAVEMEMNIPNVLKDDGKGNVVPNVPYLVNVRTRMYSWDDWTATVVLDPFQLKETPGYTFIPTGKGVTLDFSTRSNAVGFSLPKGYDLQKIDVAKSQVEIWQGLYLDEFTVKFPMILESADKKADNKKAKSGKDEKSDKQNKRISLSVKGFYIDKSGVSFNISAKNIADFNTCKLGGWGISLDNIYFDVLQSNFNKAGFNGKFSVPLLNQKNEKGNKEKAKIGYDCAISRTQKGDDSSFKYTFKTQQVSDSIYLDAFLATMSLNKEQTHFFVEYENNKTRVELCMGGKISIKGPKRLTKLNLWVPDVAFSGFRLANFKTPSDKRALTEQTHKSEGTKEKPSDSQTVKELANNVDGEIKAEQKALDGVPVYEYESPDKNFYFCLGQWKLASPKKKLGSFTFTLDNIGMRHNADKIGLDLEGSIGFMDDKLVAGAGIVLWGKVDLKEFDFNWDRCQFTKAIVKSGFGGVNVEGSFEMSESELTVNGKTQKSNGYSGGLKIDMRGMFKLAVEGSWGEGVRTEQSGNEKIFSYASMKVSAEMKTGIQIPPAVQLNGFKGGFYFNTDIAGTPKYGSYGGVIGLTVSSIGTDNLVSAPMELTVVYDKENNRLSNFIMQGDVYALYAEKPEDALIKAKAKFAYLNDDDEKSLTLNVTYDAVRDMADKAGELLKDLGVEIKAPEQGDGEANLDAFDAKNEDNASSHTSSTKTKGEKDKKSNILAKAGMKINLELKVTLEDKKEKSNKTKWHLYLGRPESEQRCQFIRMDFQAGDPESPVYVRCKEMADAYLCLGNELPNDGQLPPLPQKVAEFLGNEVKQERTLNSKTKVFEMFTPSGSGGAMLGASCTGELALNAVVCYADVDLMAGFDLALKKLKTAKCGDGRPAGKNGYYANGQIYAYAQGEMGLMLDIWIFKGKLPIIDAAAGVVFKGGIPNPSWVYGKVKAKARLLGGLIKFNGSIELKAGRVCMPNFENPLDDIKIFEEAQPGSESKETGWSEKNKVSVYTEPRYTTNMTIDRQLRLVDEASAYKKAKYDEDYMKYAKQSERVYVFHVDSKMKLEEFDDAKATKPSAVHLLFNKTSNKEAFSLTGLGRLNANKFYKLILMGYAKELVKGHEVDPIFNDSTTRFKDEHRAWRDTSIVYFRTGDLPTEIVQDIKISLPEKSTSTYKSMAYLDEAAKPILSLCGSRSDKWQNGLQVQADLEVYNPKSKQWEVPDQHTVKIGCTFDGEFYPMGKNGKAIGLDEAIAKKKAENATYFTSTVVIHKPIERPREEAREIELDASLSGLINRLLGKDIASRIEESSRHAKVEPVKPAKKPANDPWRVDTIQIASYAGSRCRNLPMEEVKESGEGYEYIIWQLANNASFAKFVKPYNKYRITIKQVDPTKQQAHAIKVQEAMKVFVAREQKTTSSAQSSNKKGSGKANVQLDLGEYINDYRKELEQTIGLDSLSRMMRTFKDRDNDEAAFTVQLYRCEFETTKFHNFVETKGRGHGGEAKSGYKESLSNSLGELLDRIFSNIREVHYSYQLPDMSSRLATDKDLCSNWSKAPSLAFVYWGNYGTISSYPMEKFAFCNRDFVSSPAMELRFSPHPGRENRGYDGVYNLGIGDVNKLAQIASTIQIKPRGNQCVPDAEETNFGNKVKVGNVSSTAHDYAFKLLTKCFRSDLLQAQMMIYTLRGMREEMMRFVGNKYRKILETPEAWNKASRKEGNHIRKQINEAFLGFKGNNPYTGATASENTFLYDTEIRNKINYSERFNDYRREHFHPLMRYISIPYVQMAYIYGLNVLADKNIIKMVKNDRKVWAENVTLGIDKDMARTYIQSYDFNVFRLSGYNIETGKYDVRPSTLRSNRYIVENWKDNFNTYPKLW